MKSLVLGCKMGVKKGGIVFSLGLHTMLFQAEIQATKACIVENIEKGYTGGNIDILSDSQVAIKVLNTFTATVDLSQFNNSCFKSPVSILVHLIFQQRPFSFNQLRDLLLLAGNLYSSFSISS